MKIIIIGAGVAGLAIGWRLCQAGASVTIFDRAQPARAATWASAGMIAAGGELGGAETPDAHFAQFSSELWPDFAGELEDAAGKSIRYRRCGALIVARNETESSEIKLWPGTERLDSSRTRALEPMLSSSIFGAVWAPDEAQVDSRALGTALTAAFVRASGTLVANEVVVKIKIENSRAVSVETPFAEYEADAIVIAAGAWSGAIDGLAPEVAPPIKPIKGQMLAVVPPAGGALPTHIVWGNGGYMVPRDDRLLIGATSEDVGFDTHLTDDAADLLSSRARALMPSLAAWTVIERWAGLRPMAPDGLPLVGRTVVDGLFVASGQYRNGILFAPAIALTMSRIMLNGEPGIAAFDPRRFSRED